MTKHQRLLPTGKQFHYNTSNESRYRINSISDLLKNKKFSIEQILAKRLVYSGKLYTLKDLNYDIKKGYFKLGGRIGCEICDSEEAELHCLHRYLCLDCEGGGSFRCEECNPHQKLYHIEYVGFEPTLVFSV